MLVTRVRSSGYEWDLFARDRISNGAKIDLPLRCPLPAMVVSDQQSMFRRVTCMLV